jgi:hypothetical protein
MLCPVRLCRQCSLAVHYCYLQEQGGVWKEEEQRALSGNFSVKGSEMQVSFVMQLALRTNR